MGIGLHRREHPSGRMSATTLVLLAALLAAAVALVFVATRGSPPPRTLHERVRTVASTLRCTVCQGLSVADSPSPVAQQMRAAIARELRDGKTPDQVRAALVAAYSEWILLTPTRTGFNLLLWIGPAVLLLAGLIAAALAVRRWSAAGRASAGSHASPAEEGATGSGVTVEDRALLARALAALEEPD